MRYLILFIIFFIVKTINAQDTDSIPRKKINAIRIFETPKIDGVLDEKIWKNIPVATNFVERQPNNGVSIPDSLHTEVKILYDDLGIYFGATMNDPSPDAIDKELTERDNIANDDFFLILLNGYNDHQQSFEFIVTAAGVQWDAKLTNDNEDQSWDGVWYSGVAINETNWTAEIFIPYSQLRFPEKDVQVWGLNMEREFRRERTRYSWNHIDNSKGAFSIYDGEIHNIKDIDAPLRLSFQPYVSSYVSSFDGESDVSFNGGMDLKYGITDGFTLDMILIPDFGQTKFDERVLNLSAFEVQYAEQRPFFTEGTELFSKGNMFYSRRVGSAPIGDVRLQPNETLVFYPQTVDLINAMKVSGRTAGGLGIGFFNAVTERTYAEVRDTVTESTRQELVEPLANYNVFVLDQRFWENSSVSLVNTNTTREGDFRDANTTGLYFDITNKKNTVRFWGGNEGSWVMQGDSTKFGMEGGAGIAKISGKHRLQGEVSFITKDYDINDLGYSSRTNFINYYGYYGYRYLQPKNGLNNLFLNFNLNLTRRLDPDLYSQFEFNFNSSFTTKNFLNFGGSFETTPFGSNDIYEPRTNERYVKVPSYYDGWVWFNTDYRKKFALNMVYDWYVYSEKWREDKFIIVSPRYRFSDKWKLFLNSETIFNNDDIGFVDRMQEDIIFGKRDRSTYINSIESQYIFTNTAALNFSFRHYYSEVNYSNFYILEQDGSLADNPFYTENRNTTYNSWNIDLRFSWWFAPGSQLTLLYRNAIDSYEERSIQDFNENFDALFNQPQLHSFSVRISYFLDYNLAKGWFGKKNATLQDTSMYGKAKYQKSM
ncbi:carbohydrate binding family 9 domain-containing protein [Galbibacter sp. BG1]|uniref:DUF5916 domain-containing protein n=1 Tax=Galbibacter sp. BG1 TaxID=1170699 RepID=UPI0015B962F3|nr:DUF5916 domain-containing protein [Galbibacter sp. BG1]QLE01533.1 carbohydrate binding family 9 domain-containing protein [Galbibacter sp. BG1]